LTFCPLDDKIISMKKTLKYIIVTVALLGTAAGCTSTVTVGPKANKNSCLSGSLGWNHVNLTVPLVSAGVKVDK
jgi:hypothetical protein